MKTIIFTFLFLISNFAQSKIIDIIINKISENTLSEEIDLDLADEIEDYLNNPININDQNINLDNLWFIDKALRDSVISYIQDGNIFYNENELLNYFNYSDDVSILVHFLSYKINNDNKLSKLDFFNNNYYFKSKIQFNTPTNSRLFLKERQSNNVKINNDLYKLNLFTKSERYLNYNTNLGLEIIPEFFINKFIIGDYKLKFGSGLVLTNSFLPGRFETFKKKYSFNNNAKLVTNNTTNFFRGIYSNMEFDILNISFFYRYFMKNFTNLDQLKQMGFIINTEINENFKLALLILNNRYNEINKKDIISITNDINIDNLNITGEYSLSNKKLNMISNIYYNYLNFSFNLNYKNVSADEYLSSSSSSIHPNENSVTLGVSYCFNKFDFSSFYNHSTFDSQSIKYLKNILVECGYRINKKSRFKLRYNKILENKLLSNNLKLSYDKVNDEKITFSLFSKLNESINIKTAIGTSIKEIKNKRNYNFEQNIDLALLENIRIKFHLFLYNTLSDLYTVKTFEEDLDGQFYFNEYYQDGYRISSIMEVDNNIYGILSIKVAYWKTSQTSNIKLLNQRDGLSIGLQYNIKL